MSKKQNDSCILMFRFLQLLTSGRAPHYTEVVDLFKEFCKDEANAQVTLHKYLNTLKILGVEPEKRKNHYYLLHSPYKIELTADDAKAISLFKSAMDIMPEGKSKKRFEDFFKTLEFHYGEETKTISDLFDMELNEQLKKYMQYCDDGFKLNITYTDNDNNEKRLMFCVPVELKFYKHKVGFRVFYQNRIVEVPLKAIKDIEQLPVSAYAQQKLATTVIFKVKGPLIKSYRLKEGEVSNGHDDDGNLIVINRGEDFDVLLKRLMRYDVLCEVISPRFVRERMIAMLDKAIRQYEEE